MYVDLNMIRAQEASTPEQLRHTSAYNRVRGLRQRVRREANAVDPIIDSPRPDHWLGELSLQDYLVVDERTVAETASRWRASNQGILPISLEKYLQLLDWTCRQIRADNRGAIPGYSSPILDRLRICEIYSRGFPPQSCE